MIKTELLKIYTAGGELKRIKLVKKGQLVIYDEEADCLICNRWRLTSGQTGGCFECDEPQFVKQIKIVLGLDHD